MSRKVFNWSFLVLAALLCHFCLRYFFGDFQGWATFPVGGSVYGVAHIKSTTLLVSGRELLAIPGVFVFGGYVIAFGLLALAVRAVVRASLHRNQNAEPGASPNGGPATPLGNSEATEGPPSVS